MNIQVTWYPFLIACVFTSTSIQEKANGQVVAPKTNNNIEQEDKAQLKLIHQRLKAYLRDQDVAIENGEKVIRLFYQKDKVADKERLSWIGKPVAFLCTRTPPNMYIAAISPTSAPLKLHVDFIPPITSGPIILQSCVWGTIKSIDLKTKTVTIEAKSQTLKIVRIG